MSDQAVTISRPSLQAWCRENAHFLTAAGLMLISALLLYVGIVAMGWRFYKEPVPWPRGVQVDKDCRLRSLPEEFTDRQGNKRFVIVKEDRDQDGRPDGEIVFVSDSLDLLKMATLTDKKRLPRRCSNWYFARIYEDVRGSPSRRRWRLDGYYYTGMLDQVPHVPERCTVAGGATLISSEDVTFNVPEVTGPWGKVVFRRALYSVYNQDDQRYTRRAEYYTFSVNGKPVSSWISVRWRLKLPWVKYAYFAKIQFAPLQEVGNIDETDRAAEEFVRCFLPKVLETLPTPEDVERLGGAAKTAS